MRDETGDNVLATAAGVLSQLLQIGPLHPAADVVVARPLLHHPLLPLGRARQKREFGNFEKFELKS